MTDVSTTIAATKPQARSRVSNGSAVLEGVDGRSTAARRYRDVLEELVRDMGGDPSGAQSAIARRAAALCVTCEQAEAEMIAGKPLDLGAFTTAANSLRRLLSDLGLERRAKDITPSLSAYLTTRSTQTAQDSFKSTAAPKVAAGTILTSDLASASTESIT
jgi:hypothetical protein